MPNSFSKCGKSPIPTVTNGSIHHTQSTAMGAPIHGLSPAGGPNIGANQTVWKWITLQPAAVNLTNR
jgi:hypothetical protein